MTAAADVLKLPVGFRFRPTEVELVSYYLQNKILGLDSHANLIIADIDILRHEPWDLPAQSLIKSDNDEWFFFSQPERTIRNQIKRSTNEGYWKVTGSERVIKARSGRVVGKKRILSFYRGRNRSGEINNWVIHEYYIPQTNPTANQRDIALCHLIKKPDKKAGAATCDEGGPSNNASDVENELQLAHAMDIQMQEYREYFEREGDRMLASSLSNADDIGLQSGFGDNEPIDGFPEYLESATWNQLYQESSEELTRTVHIKDSTSARACRVADTEALSAQVKIGAGSSRRDRDVMIEEQAHKQMILPERAHEQFDIVAEGGLSDFVNSFLTDSSGNEATPTFQINSLDVAFANSYTNERGSRTGYPLSSTREAVKLPEKPKPIPRAPEKPRPVLAFDEYYTNERGRRTGYPPSSTRDAVKLPEKPKEPERPKPRPAVDLSKESITKFTKDKKETQGKGSSFISWETIPLTSPQSVYLFNAVLGAILFVVFARELVGNWC